MIITNRLNLPQPLVDMAESDYMPLSPNTYRVTSLLKGVRETILERRHQDEIEQDVSDMIWLLFGTAVEVPIGDYVLSGQFDLYNAETRTVTDYKTASVWKVIFGDFKDWRRQTLIYAYMLRKIGFKANNAEIVALLKDHSKKDAKIKDHYPLFPVEKITFHFTEDDFAECEQWLQDKFAEIATAEKLPDDQLPLCTLEERYNSGDKYAVMKRGRKTALRVLDNKDDAEKWMSDNGGDYIDTRPGEDKKCKDYCSACQFCNYYCEHVKEV